METFSALLAICAGNSPVPGEFPTQRPVTRSFDVFFDLRLNKRLSKQWWGWWFETLSHLLWLHRNVWWVFRRKVVMLQKDQPFMIRDCHPNFRQTSNITRTLVGNKTVDHSDVVASSPVGAAPTTSSFSTKHLGPVSISEKTSFRKISWSLETARFVFRIIRSLWNLTGTSAALLPMCLSNFKAIWQFKVPFSWLRDFARFYEKTYFRILRRGPGPVLYLCLRTCLETVLAKTVLWQVLDRWRCRFSISVFDRRSFFKFKFKFLLTH